MIRSIIFALLVASTPCQAGYSVFIKAQPSPSSITVHGVDGPEIRNNPGPSQAYPSSFQRKICEAKNIYSSQDLERAEVWADPAGQDSSAYLFAACPQIRDLKRAEIRLEGDAKLKAIALPYLPAERETWPVQMQEAHDFLFDPINTQTPMLSEMASGRGISLEALVGLVWDSVVLFRQASGNILGQQQFLLDWINREPDFSTLAAISWEP